MNTPRAESDTRHIGSAVPGGEGLARVNKKLNPAKKIVPLDYDSDIDPDDLLPVYLESKTKLFHLQSPNSRRPPNRRNRGSNVPKLQNTLSTPDPASAKLVQKIKKIEDDVLFDKYLADQQWEIQRIQLEKEVAANRNATEPALDSNDSQGSETLVDSEDEVSREASKIGQAMLDDMSSDDDAALADLFASLPVNEVDPLTGKSNTVVNGLNGVKVFIRDFGKWTGVNPTRVLEEACRAR
jgi:ATP-dependent RNA helicase DHX29